LRKSHRDKEKESQRQELSTYPPDSSGKAGISKEDRRRKNIPYQGNLKEKELLKRVNSEETFLREDPDSEKTAIDNHISSVYTLDIMQTVIHIKSDKEVKENAQKAAKELGLTLSDVINASLRNFIRTREVIFSHTPRMTPELEKIIAKVEKDIKHNRNIFGPFETAEEMDKFLDSQ